MLDDRGQTAKARAQALAVGLSAIAEGRLEPTHAMFGALASLACALVFDLVGLELAA